MARYADKTTTPVSKTREEFEKLMYRFGAERWAQYQESDRAVLFFEIRGVPYKFTLPLVNGDEMRLWRCLLASVKGRLIAVEEGIETFEQAFIGHVVLKGGHTVAESYASDLPALASAGRIHQLALPGGES